LGNENGPWVTYRSDEYGFHNPTGIWQSAPLDIAALGDSYTHGHCVPSDKNFVALIRRRFPATLNLGVSGNGPLLELATLKEYLLPLKPKIVLWFYYEGNDLSDLQNERQSALLRRYLHDDFRGVSVPGGALYFIYLPTWERYGYSNPGVLANQRMKILTVVNDLTIPIIDMHTVFQSQSDPLSLFPFGEPGHYSEKGHKVVAEEVLRAISMGHQRLQHVQVDQEHLELDVDRNAVKN
jgi:lysophospholipase L1-like esterase